MSNKEKDEKETSRKPFVAQDDRPDMSIKLDTPVSELRVGDLAAILRLGSRKDFLDGKSWQKDDFDDINWFFTLDPRRRFSSPDPRLGEVIRSLAGLTEQMSQLADQVEELKKGRKS